MGEFELIQNYFSPLAKGFPGSLDLTDDAALVALPAGQELVITKDAICAGVHFTGDETPAQIAQKLLRVNLSDIAAKGAKPLCYFLAIMAPKNTTTGWFAEFAHGLAAGQQEFGVHLAGGDTTATLGPLALSLTMIGAVPKGSMLRRSGAKPGDSLFVSGTLGDSALGLLAIREKIPHDTWLQNRYLLPQPRVALGQSLRGIATSCMDISDGLMQDLGHICKASGVGAVVYRDRLPLSKATQALVKKNPDCWDNIYAGGDDYELLFTAPSGSADAVATLSSKLALPITSIGRIDSGSGPTLLDSNGSAISISHPGYRHF